MKLYFYPCIVFPPPCQIKYIWKCSYDIYLKEQLLKITMSLSIQLGGDLMNGCFPSKKDKLIPQNQLNIYKFLISN